METRNYDPLKEGYSGAKSVEKGYTGSNASTSQAPSTLPKIQSAVVSSSKPQPSSSDNSQGNKK